MFVTFRPKNTLITPLEAFTANESGGYCNFNCQAVSMLMTKKKQNKNQPNLDIAFFHLHVEVHTHLWLVVNSKFTQNTKDLLHLTVF